MHYVDRGPEPAGLGTIRRRLTGGWVRFYRRRQGKKPGDARWREFQPALSEVFFSVCGYCETECNGQVDHFRPKRRDPELVYEWTNWILACPTCNLAKGGKWPSGGYADPCAERGSDRPENLFWFDTKNGLLLAKDGLSEQRLRRAEQMIDDLKLNDSHRRQRRLLHLQALALALKSPDENVVDFFSSREQALSSISRQFLSERGFLLQ
jgi:uncharacterized protein (TIGR02646 family)